MPLTEEDVIEEQIHFSKVVATFEQYAKYALSANNRRRRDLYSLPLADQALFDELGWKDKLIGIDNAILVNARFLRQIVSDPEIFIGAPLGDAEGGEEEDVINEVDVRHPTNLSAGHPPNHSHLPNNHSHERGLGHGHSHGLGQPSRSHDRSAGPSIHGHGPRRGPYRPTEFDMDKLRSTIKQFVRDWSAEGKVERDACYEPMKEALVRHFNHVPAEERAKLRVLVPGAGLGRLAYEVACLGFSCQGNEFSHYMLLASYFILNRTDKINQHRIYPHVHSLSNIPNRSALLRPVTIPDALPSELPSSVDFSLVAGDFEEVYGADDTDSDEPQAGKWDAVLTCFFIDTAKNIVNYLRIIRKVLAPGGVWINLGPLLWHWENNNTNDISIELDLEEVKVLCGRLGFKLNNERTIDTTYTNNTESMLGYVYHTAFWTATRSQDEENETKV